eukprot:s275_g18.t1
MTWRTFDQNAKGLALLDGDRTASGAPPHPHLVRLFSPHHPGVVCHVACSLPMDIDDFLIQYDLSEEQLELAAKLKAEANFRQLLNVLADHVLFFSRPRPRRAPASKLRAEVFAWFSELSVEDRLSVLTCHDAGWVRTVLKMCRLRGWQPRWEGHFKVAPKPVPPAGRVSKASASGTVRRNEAQVPRDPNVHYRRPHRLPDGEILAPPATADFRAASAALLAGLRVAFQGCCCASMAFDWGVIMPSPATVTDCEAFFSLLDDVSLGRFLREKEEHPKMGATGWPEAPWLRQWATHAPLSAYLGSRLEVLLLQAYASRMQAEPSLPLAEVWASMPPAQRRQTMARLGRSLLRRLFSETHQAMTSGGLHNAFCMRVVASRGIILARRIDWRSSCWDMI